MPEKVYSLFLEEISNLVLTKSFLLFVLLFFVLTLLYLTYSNLISSDFIFYQIGNAKKYDFFIVINEF